MVAMICKIFKPIKFEFYNVFQITILRNFYPFKLAKFIPCKTYFTVLINLQIVEIVIIKSILTLFRMTFFLGCSRMAGGKRPLPP